VETAWLEPVEHDAGIAAGPEPTPPAVEPLAAVPLAAARHGLAPTGTAPRPNGHAIAEAFNALLAAEQGEPMAGPPNLGVMLWAPVISNAFVDEVARRVVERLAPDTAREVVSRVVNDIAERLVREEVGRVRERGLH
jgi:hypothetical protein